MKKVNPKLKELANKTWHKPKTKNLALAPFQCKALLLSDFYQTTSVPHENKVYEYRMNTTRHFHFISLDSFSYTRYLDIYQPSLESTTTWGVILYSTLSVVILRSLFFQLFLLIFTSIFPNGMHILLFFDYLILDII